MSFNKPFEHMLPTMASASIPWNSNDMFWTVNNSNNMVMEFNAIKNDPTNSNYEIMRRGKRKPEPPPKSRTPKILLTEEFMAHHLNSMHISKDFKSHNSDQLDTDINNSNNNDILMVSAEQQHTPNTYFVDDGIDADNTAYAYGSQEEFQQKLKNAQRISICEEVQKIKNEILPAALVERIERPCTALILWKPLPLSNLEHFIQNNNNKVKKNSKEDNDMMESTENIRQQQRDMQYFEINKHIDDLAINLESGMDLD